MSYTVFYHGAGKTFLGRAHGAVMLLEEAGAKYAWAAKDDVPEGIGFVVPMVTLALCQRIPGGLCLPLACLPVHALPLIPGNARLCCRRGRQIAPGSPLAGSASRGVCGRQCCIWAHPMVRILVSRAHRRICRR